MVQNSNKFYTMAFRFSQSVVLDNILIEIHPWGGGFTVHKEDKSGEEFFYCRQLGADAEQTHCRFQFL